MQPIYGWNKNEQEQDYASRISKILNDQIELLKSNGKKIIIINPIPLPPNNPINTYARKFNATPPDNFYISLEDFLKSTKNTKDILKNALATKYVHPENIFCATSKNSCTIIENNIPLYFDEAHLSLPGTEKLISNIVSNALSSRY